MKHYNHQYKIIFYLSWICLYLIFPSWINLHSYVQAWGVSNISFPIARSIAILGLIVYFFISASLLNHYFNALLIDKPVIMSMENIATNITGNLGLIIVCCLSIILHIPSLSFVQVIYLIQGLWLYEFSTRYWNALFNVPFQYGFWILLCFFILLIKQKKAITFISNYICTKYSVFKSYISIMFFFMTCFISFFYIYASFFPYLDWGDSMQLLRYPPVSHFIYLITYYAFGVSDTGPRIVQLIFNVLGAVYLYRTILLFREKETALLGATIYLFSPVIFYYATASALASGKLFFIIIISYYFLSYIKTKDNRDLILSAFFIGIGYLYKQDILILFVICLTYFLLKKIKDRDWNSVKHIKILLLSLIPILPWHLMIGKSSVYYKIVWSKLISFNRITAYTDILHSQLSTIIFILMLSSIVFIAFAKKDDLSLFFGLSFVTYYVFFTVGETIALHRYSMALYPAISVLLAQLVCNITERIRWKHMYKLVYSVLTVYLIILCLIPRTSSDIITFKYKDVEMQYYPIDKATDWIKNNTRIDEKILILFMDDYYRFYAEKIYRDKDKINQKRFISYKLINAQGLFSSLNDLQEYCEANGISYIMFRYSPLNDLPAFDKEIANRIVGLKKQMDRELIQTAKFNVDDNYIIIYKLKSY